MQLHLIVRPGGPLIQPPDRPPLQVSLRTGFGMFDMPENLTGINPRLKPTPDTMRSNSSASQWPAILDWAEAHDVRVLAKFVGGANSNFRIGGGGADACFFDPQKWKDRWDTFVTAVRAISGLETRIRNAVKNGQIVGHLGLDDFTGVDDNCDSGGFTRAVTFDELDGPNGIFTHAKFNGSTGWNWMPQGVRARTTEMYNLGGVLRSYDALDFCLNQWKCGLSGNNGIQFAADCIQRGEQCGLASIAGANLLNRGCGNTAGWSCKQGCTSGSCGMSPAEVINIIGGQLANPKIAHAYIWAYDGSNCPTAFRNGTYYNLPEITAAFETLWQSKALGRAAGPISINGSLVPA